MVRIDAVRIGMQNRLHSKASSTRRELGDERAVVYFQPCKSAWHDMELPHVQQSCSTYRYWAVIAGLSHLRVTGKSIQKDDDDPITKSLLKTK